MRFDYYSESWDEATDKFIKSVHPDADLKWAVSQKSKYDIPYVSFGTGTDKVVINSGLHGLEGFFGSAAQIWLMKNLIPNLSKKFLKKYTLVLIHVINGWGMQNRMREVIDPADGLVDLNRNFGVDFSTPDALPKNEKYKQAHDLLLSKPDEKLKLNALKQFYCAHKNDGVWDSIKNGQYYEPYGLFYGGNRTMLESKMTLHIYDSIVKHATSLTSMGLHTGLGRFYKKLAKATSGVYVSHPSKHQNTQKFREIFGIDINVIPDEAAIKGPTLLGDLVDCLENRYADKQIPIYTADFEVGTGEYPIISPILKRMDMGDARYDLLNYGRINNQTWRNLTESWYPSAPGWRDSALSSTQMLFRRLFDYLENSK